MRLLHAGCWFLAAFDAGSCVLMFVSHVSAAVLEGGGDRFVLVLAFYLQSSHFITFLCAGIKQKQAEVIGQSEKGKK